MSQLTHFFANARGMPAVAVLASGLLLGAAPAPDRWAGRPHGPVYLTAPAMDASVRDRILPQVETLLVKLLSEGRAMTLDGVKVFESGDKFLPGKIANAMAYRITELPKGDPRLDRRLRDFADIADLTLADANETWGQYYYISALHRLNEAGLLERAVRPATLAKLRKSLDWRRFVRPDGSLVDLPNNYYGVAFSIARLRFLLGWEDASGSEALLARTLDHYRRYSGAYGFADETEGKGRFDRYSVLLIGEIAQRLVETGMTPSDEVKGWLRNSARLMLLRANLTGEGWEYGRSIGAYGETAFLEVLTAAARLKLLSPLEERMAYAFSSRIAARYVDFWIDPATGSVDLWGQGRRTDAYRGKHRIFGENLSLARQYVYTNAIWNELGYRARAPDRGYAAWLDSLPRSTMTWFARGQHDRAVVTMRDRGRVIALPLINGAEGQHMNTPYFPAPFSPGMLQGSADSSYPQLVPEITLADGSVLMPLAWFRDVRVARNGAVTNVSWRQDALDRMGGQDAVEDRRATIETRVRFSPGRIERRDRIVATTPIRSIATEFATYSSRPTTDATGTRFGEGEVTRFVAKGYGRCTVRPADSAKYRSPTGPFATVVRCDRTVARRRAGPLALVWSLSYE